MVVQQYKRICMKNIHIIPTDKPSRLFKDKYNYYLSEEYLEDNHILKNQNIYIISNEEIKEGDYFPLYNEWNNKIEAFKKWDGKLPLMAKVLQLKLILTTDQDLIADGIEQISENVLLKIVEHINFGKNIESFDKL